jgi:di/tricarboxylate transporter
LVEPGGPVDGLTIAAASLRHLAGVFLVQVERAGEVLGAVGPDHVLHGDDILRFVGNARDAADLQERSGLRALVSTGTSIPRGPMAFFEAVVGAGSQLVGESLRDIGFRDRYRAVVLAIHRADQRVLGKLGDARLRVGDTLLVLAQPSFSQQWSGSGDFLFVSRLDAHDPFRSEKGWVAGAIGIVTVVLASTGAVSILEATLVGAFAMVLFGVLTASEARASVDLNVVVLIAASFGVGAAIAGSGLANRFAEGIVGVVDGSSTAIVVVAVAVLTIVLTEVVTNNGAAVLAFPIGLAVAAEAGVDPRLVAITISVAASASFLTPIGYQTNTMVWGPGGYRFWDYARLGAPLTLLTLIVIGIVAG